AVTARGEDVAPDPRKESRRRLEGEAPLEEVRRPAMLCRELREPSGVAAGPIQSLILEGERLVDLPLRLPASDGHEAIRIGLRLGDQPFAVRPCILDILEGGHPEPRRLDRPA